MSEQLKIKQLSEDFIWDYIQNEDPSGLCFITSYSLLIYLSSKQIKTELKTGLFEKILEDNQILKVNHYWLQVKSNGDILDSTIRQFDMNFESTIYIGKIDENYISKTYIIDKSLKNNWFFETYENWKTPFVDPLYPLDGDFIKRMICFTLKISSKLYIELESIENPQDEINNHFGLYFQPIFTFLVRWNNNEISFKIPDEVFDSNFEIMLKGALMWHKGSLSQ